MRDFSTTQFYFLFSESLCFPYSMFSIFYVFHILCFPYSMFSIFYVAKRWLCVGAFTWHRVKGRLLKREISSTSWRGA
jgi:hypothetical protein